MSLFNRVYYFGIGDLNEVVYYEDGEWTEIGKLLAGRLTFSHVMRYGSKVFFNGYTKQSSASGETHFSQIYMWEIEDPDNFGSIEVGSAVDRAEYSEKMFIIDSSQINEEICDVNECFHENHNCNMNAICSNTFGSFICACKAGYMGDGVSCGEGMTFLATVFIA